jgi:hypothetical protein
MLRRDAPMQESSRGASPEWTALREPSVTLVSKQIDVVGVERVFPFVVDDASIGRVVREWSAAMVLSAKYHFVVDSPILPVI